MHDINQAVINYRRQWQALSQARINQTFFAGLKPTALGWKSLDLAEFDRLFVQLREHCDQIHLGWINERWLATMHLKNSRLEWGIRIIKLMQRRPGSSDAVGLDHVDFLLPKAANESNAQVILQKEPSLKWSLETNNAHCNWISIWFNDTEAKLRTNTVLDVCIAELRETCEAL